MTLLLAIIIAAGGWLQGGAEGWVWWYRLGCSADPAIVTDAPDSYGVCAEGQAVVNLRGPYRYLYVDGERVAGTKVHLPQVWR